MVLVGVALIAALLGLGTWQVQRRTWKLDLIARVEQRVHAPATALPAPAQWPALDSAEAEYLPVVLRGRWLENATVLTQAVTELGGGFWVLTALQQDDGAQVLVNRGFVPQDQRAQWLQNPSAPADGTVTVQGLLRRSEPGGGFLRANDPAQQRWYSRDVAAIAQALGLPRAAPFFIDAGLPTRTAPGDTAADTAWPRAGMTVVRFHNSHLVYALTWYGLALMAAGALWYVLRDIGRSRASSPPPEPPP